MIPGQSQQFFEAAAAQSGGAAGYEIERSLRFNSADSAYLNRTPSSAGNRRTWTWSGWVKRSKFDGARRTLFRANSSPETHISFSETAQGNPESLMVFGASGGGYLLTDAVFRDPSAWYHIFVAWDTTQTTNTNRVKIYVNGVQIESFFNTSYPGASYEGGINSTNVHGLGANSTGGELHDGYLADIHFIDGQALAPTDFGQFDSNSVWQPKEYSGTYGTNGFHLDFSDNSSNAALGDDSSGNNNDWTVNNLVADGGVVYSNYVSGYINSLGAQPATNLFDGNTSTQFFSSTISGSGIKFVPPTAITGSIELYLRNGDTDNSTISYSLDNGSTFTNLTTTGGAGSYVSIGSQTISNTNGIIVRHVTTDGTNSVDWRAIRVDGTVLLDGTPSNTDSLVDSPTNGTQTDTGVGNEVVGNYATLNPIDSNIGSNLTNGNLDAAGSSSWSAGHARATFGLSSGKWYWEVALTGGSGLVSQIGFCNKAFNLAETYGVVPPNSWTYYPPSSAILYPSGGISNYFPTSASIGDIIACALDMDSQTVVFYKNGVGGATIDLTTTTTSSTDNIDTLFPLVGVYNANASANFGQRPFAYTAPSGFNAINTASLSDPTIADGSTAMDATLYTGDGSTSRSITGLGFSPDLVWVKCRSNAESNVLSDIVRGANKQLFSNSTSAETSNTNEIQAFNSDGFDVGNNGRTNYNGFTYVGWAWDGGTSTVSNTDGSITSSVRANASAGFSIVTYTGTGSNATVGHGLGAAPSLIITKSRNNAYNWTVYHSSLGINQYLWLDSTAAASSSTGYWNTAPTSTIFGVGNNNTGSSGSNLVAYCFAPVVGYSSFGSYVGNGSASDGPFVFTGMRPRWIMVKRTDSTEQWYINDAARDDYNVTGKSLRAQSSGAEASTGGANSSTWDILSNGFKLRDAGAGTNASGGTYIYAAFAESPFAYARAR
jgi:hypothetical protein